MSIRRYTDLCHYCCCNIHHSPRIYKSGHQSILNRPAAMRLRDNSKSSRAMPIVFTLWYLYYRLLAHICGDLRVAVAAPFTYIKHGITKMSIYLLTYSTVEEVLYDVGGTKIHNSRSSINNCNIILIIHHITPTQLGIIGCDRYWNY